LSNGGIELLNANPSIALKKMSRTVMASKAQSPRKFSGYNTQNDNAQSQNNKQTIDKQKREIEK